MVGTVVTAILVVAATYVTNLVLEESRKPDRPFTWTVSTRPADHCLPHTVVGKTEREASPPDNLAELAAWAKRVEAAPGSGSPVTITLQGSGEEAVVLLDMKINVVSAPVPAQVFTVGGGCGGGITPRSFSSDLDQRVPVLVAQGGLEPGPGGLDELKELPPVNFPYRISSKDPEVFAINTSAERCDCRWTLDLHWSSGGETGWARIDDQGAPFRTVGAAGGPRYVYDLGRERWQKI
ncbi:hypothetical protein [Rhizohabitans arisaemae]|uniref:hypothetical protein n=1 Tax=Rhizohabitans arisaemae TaxID=2720610 RepID=UPI0024B1EC9E|nr:hypothetical protein [Rhizohabitans arisaemae]